MQSSSCIYTHIHTHIHAHMCALLRTSLILLKFLFCSDESSYENLCVHIYTHAHTHTYSYVYTPVDTLDIAEILVSQRRELVCSSVASGSLFLASLRTTLCPLSTLVIIRGVSSCGESWYAGQLHLVLCC
jgi:hypothetical protein